MTIPRLPLADRDIVKWTPEQLNDIHDIAYWTNIFSETEEIDILSIREMESNEELRNDWMACDHEYARSDRKAMEAGGKYLNFISAILRRK